MSGHDRSHREWNASDGVDGDGSKHVPMRPPPRFADPMTWSVGMFGLGRVAVRLHAVFLATVLVILFRGAWFSGEAGGILDPGLALVLVAVLFLTVLVEELAVAFVTRALGGSAAEVVLHPLGGLDATISPPGWTRQAMASASGLIVLGVVVVLSGVMLTVLTGGQMGLAFGNPLSLDGLFEVEMHVSWWVTTVYFLQWCAMLVLLVNLLPTPPMRGWIVLHALCRWRLGWNRGRRFALRLAVCTLVALAAWSILYREWVPLVFVVFASACVREEFLMLRATYDAL
ncbi:MAG: hypothetical protein MK085_03680, partial [Phycisphaerales bacterium]|nr:hypothetical protein [Phycisphaerales bacterium]